MERLRDFTNKKYIKGYFQTSKSPFVLQYFTTNLAFMKKESKLETERDNNQSKNKLKKFYKREMYYFPCVKST